MRSYRRAFSNPSLLVGAVIIFLIGLLAVFAPVLAPPAYDDPYRLPRDGIGNVPLPPRDGHPLGTFAQQYDIYHGLIWGTRLAFSVSLVVTFGRVLIGTLIGLVSGYFGKTVDSVLMRMTDAFLSFPILAITMLVLALFGRSWYYTAFSMEVVNSTIDVKTLMSITLIAFGWMSYARLIRGNVLVEKGKEYADAARVSGARDLRILFKHLLPNSTQGLFVMVSSDISGVVVTLAVLNFLGLATYFGSEPSANWGEMLAYSRNWMVGTPADPFAYWFTYLPPAIAILAFTIGWNLIGDGLRVVLDPRAR